jgi:GNAT superfamily N-acetyltransferase
MSLELRPAVVSDAEACGRVIHAAFKDVDERYGFHSLFQSVDQATHVAKLFIDLASIHGIVAVEGGDLRGVVFLDRGDPIKSIGLIAVDPAGQRQAVGRRLMLAAIDYAGDVRGIRLVQAAFNVHAMGLYASLGFAVKEPLVAITGRPRSLPPPTATSRPITSEDLGACAALCERVHGVNRTVDLQDALALFKPVAIVREGRIVAYTYTVHAGSLAWGVAESPDDLETLLLVLGATVPAPLRFNLPTRDARLFRWCLDQGLRIDRPLTLMARGWYQDPRGSYFPSGFY